MHTNLLAIATALGLASSASALTVVPTFVADPNTGGGYTATTEQLHFSAGSAEVDRFQITPPIPGLLIVTIDESPPELGKVFFTNYEVIGGAAQQGIFPIGNAFAGGTVGPIEISGPVEFTLIFIVAPNLVPHTAVQAGYKTTFRLAPLAPVPEPATWCLMAVGLLALGVTLRCATRGAKI